MRTAASQPVHAAQKDTPVKAGKAANFFGSSQGSEMTAEKKLQAMDSLLCDIMANEDEFYELETFLGEEKNYDIDSLAFFVKVTEFKKETNALNSMLAAGMIIDNYLAEDAQYYIGNEIQSDDLINRLIGLYEMVVTKQ